MLSKLFSKTHCAILMAFLQVSAFADIIDPTGSSASKEDIAESIGNVSEIIAYILGGIFGLFALTSLLIIGFIFLKDKEQGTQLLFGWGGGILLFSSATTIASLVFAAVN